MNLKELKELIKEIDDDFDDDAEIVMEVDGAQFYLDAAYAGDDGDLVLEAGDEY